MRVLKCVRTASTFIRCRWSTRKRHKRAAWSYEAPRPEMAQVAGRFGFWEDVEVK